MESCCAGHSICFWDSPRSPWPLVPRGGRAQHPSPTHPLSGCSASPPFPKRGFAFTHLLSGSQPRVPPALRVPAQATPSLSDSPPLPREGAPELLLPLPHKDCDFKKVLFQKRRHKVFPYCCQWVLWCVYVGGGALQHGAPASTLSLSRAPQEQAQRPKAPSPSKDLQHSQHLSRSIGSFSLPGPAAILRQGGGEPPGSGGVAAASPPKLLHRQYAGRSLIHKRKRPSSEQNPFLSLKSPPPVPWGGGVHV